VVYFCFPVQLRSRIAERGVIQFSADPEWLPFARTLCGNCFC
jgi:hypothetical protein